MLKEDIPQNEFDENQLIDEVLLMSYNTFFILGKRGWNQRVLEMVSQRDAICTAGAHIFDEIDLGLLCPVKFEVIWLSCIEKIESLHELYLMM